MPPSRLSKGARLAIPAMLVLALVACNSRQAALRPLWRVTRVVDGDTLIAVRDDVQERVRLIGIDAPERGRPGADAATAWLAGEVLGRDVYFEYEVDRPTRDRYGRLLAYVYRADGFDVCLEALRAGVVRDNSAEYPHRRAAAFNLYGDLCGGHAVLHPFTPPLSPSTCLKSTKKHIKTSLAIPCAPPCWIQNPVGLKPREGSTPSFGTTSFTGKQGVLHIMAPTLEGQESRNLYGDLC